MDESTQRYHEIRALLEQLVASWPWDRPDTSFENAKVYLGFHCADCGAKLRMNDLAVVLELEMLRLGTIDVRKVLFSDPICVRCYVRRAAPICHGPDHEPHTIQSPLVGLLPEICHYTKAARRRPDTPLPPQMPDGAWHDDHTGIVPFHPDNAGPPPSRHDPVSLHAWWRLHSGHGALIIGMLLIVLLISIVLVAFQTAQHAHRSPMCTTSMITNSCYGTEDRYGRDDASWHG